MRVRWPAVMVLIAQLVALGHAVAATPNLGEMSSGLLEALRVGTARVVRQLGAVDGYNGDPAIHIPLPETLGRAQSALRTVGMPALADDLELKLNRAAERAAPEAKQVFWDAIKRMSFDDARRIYDGPDDAATRYFQAKTAAPLSERMAPIIDEALREVGAIRAYDEMIAEYKSLPFVPDVKADLKDYVVGKALDGLFHYLAVEETAIRRNPAKRTNDLLRRVFGN